MPEATRSRTRPRKTLPESLRREEGPDNTLTPSLQVVGINFCCSKPHSCDNLLRYPRETNTSRGSRLPVVLRAGGRPHGNMRVCRDRLSPAPVCVTVFPRVPAKGRAYQETWPVLCRHHYTSQRPFRLSRSLLPPPRRTPLLRIVPRAAGLSLLCSSASKGDGKGRFVFLRTWQTRRSPQRSFSRLCPFPERASDAAALHLHPVHPLESSAAQSARFTSVMTIHDGITAVSF